MNYTQLIYNAIALFTVAKDADSKNAFDKVLEEKGVKIGENRAKTDKLLHLTCKDFLQTNASEAMGSDQAGTGQEFIDQEILMAEIQDRVSKQTSLLSLIRIRRMAGPKITLPAKGKKRRMKMMDEEQDNPGTANYDKAKTAKVTLEAKQFATTIVVPDSLMEDSVYNMAQYVIDELAEAYESTFHNVILNGDTATADNTNINIIDGAVASLEFNDVLAANGVRKIAIANSGTVNGGTLELADVRAARQLMGAKGIKPEDLAMCIEYNTYMKLLGLSQVETIEKFGDAATIKNGVIVAIDGMRVIPREELLKTDANGKYPAAGGTLGQIVIIHLPSLYVGSRRDFKTATQRQEKWLQTEFTGSCRIAVTVDNNQVETSATLPATLIRNITL